MHCVGSQDFQLTSLFRILITIFLCLRPPLHRKPAMSSCRLSIVFLCFYSTSLWEARLCFSHIFYCTCYICTSICWYYTASPDFFWYACIQYLVFAFPISRISLFFPESRIRCLNCFFSPCHTFNWINKKNLVPPVGLFAQQFHLHSYSEGVLRITKLGAVLAQLTWCIRTKYFRTSANFVLT